LLWHAANTHHDAGDRFAPSSENTSRIRGSDQDLSSGLKSVSIRVRGIPPRIQNFLAISAIAPIGAPQSLPAAS
jgi:hypothetical protein